MRESENRKMFMVRVGGRGVRFQERFGIQAKCQNRQNRHPSTQRPQSSSFHQHRLPGQKTNNLVGEVCQQIDNKKCG